MKCTARRPNDSDISADALKPGGTVHRLLEDSKRFAVELAKQLRERIYESVVPLLAKGVAEARNLKNPTADDLDLTYPMALTVLFRLLFVAYAEDPDLLPYQHSEAYEIAADHARRAADRGGCQSAPKIDPRCLI